LLISWKKIDSPTRPVINAKFAANARLRSEARETTRPYAKALQNNWWLWGRHEGVSAAGEFHFKVHHVR